MQLSQGLSHSLIALPRRISTVSQLAAHVVESFGLQDSCKAGVALQVDGFVLPAWQPLSVLGHDDVIRMGGGKEGGRGVIGDEVGEGRGEGEEGRDGEEEEEAEGVEEEKEEEEEQGEQEEVVEKGYVRKEKEEGTLETSEEESSKGEKGEGEGEEKRKGGGAKKGEGKRGGTKGEAGGREGVAGLKDTATGATRGADAKGAHAAALSVRRVRLKGVCWVSVGSCVGLKDTATGATRGAHTAATRGAQPMLLLCLLGRCVQWECAGSVLGVWWECGGSVLGVSWVGGIVLP
ncbi:unnamed protein product [Closterium sp. Yama58-4]|nr:unnamed protein product [Closterium sp. Yama58-4]